ncbi:restriction endonuclease [Pseudomonas sp. NFX71]|uniref:nSTAND3 domain-containing NTPase n=1 Tax=Pseudomonas sp. NFX71 TaxID=3399121 RepID=UPI003A877690
MARYDFKSLSPQDFEELTRDLLQAEWDVPIEAFKAGRDLGIDLRYSSLDAGTTIVQCKHFSSSTFSTLLSHLRNSELSKVQRLKPKRYLLVTSLGLTVAQKDKIVETMHPFILSPSDVLGCGDLNGRLSLRPEIERANFKLWFTGTEVIERILHNAEVCQAQFEVERIRKKLPVVVQNEAFSRAREILNEQRVVIISGVPGIGKTTLAEMLLYAHLDEGYEPVVVQSDINEGKKLFRATKNQVFYYDDFLGQTFLGDQRSYLFRNQDAALLSFMEMVRDTPNSRFVLTTREHIFQQAFLGSERFLHSAMLSLKCVLTLNDYSFGQRARILYNHLYFSDLPQAYKNIVLDDDFFMDIIKHDHFNPRLIEWLTSLTRMHSPPVAEYKQRITELLQSPDKIWSHAFETQISDAARDLLLTLYTLGATEDLIDLEPAFEALHKGACNQYNRPRSASDFHSALQELDGAFLEYDSGHAAFINPSIRDFTSNILCKTPAIAIGMIPDVTRFKQIKNLWDLAAKRQDQPLMAAFLTNKSLLRSNLERTLYGESSRRTTSLTGYPIKKYVDTYEDARLDTIGAFAEEFKDLTFVDLAITYAEFLVSHWRKNIIDFEITARILNAMKARNWYWGKGGNSVYRIVLDGLLNHLDEASAWEWATILEFKKMASEWSNLDESRLLIGLEIYRLQGFDSDRENCSSVDELEDLRSALIELKESYGVDLEVSIEAIESDIAEREKDAPFDDGEGGGFARRTDPLPSNYVTESDVREMFKTLRE